MKGASPKQIDQLNKGVKLLVEVRRRIKETVSQCARYFIASLPLTDSSTAKPIELILGPYIMSTRRQAEPIDKRFLVRQLTEKTE